MSNFPNGFAVVTLRLLAVEARQVDLKDSVAGIQTVH